VAVDLDDLRFVRGNAEEIGDRFDELPVVEDGRLNVQVSIFDSRGPIR
jgi:hypothetical protein